MRRHFALRNATLVCALTALALAGCDGNGDGGTTPNVNAPVISNLTVTRMGGCTVQGLSGTVQMITLNYEDINGDVRGGQINAELRAGGETRSTLTEGIPSGSVSVTGTTSGQISTALCIAILGLFGTGEGELRVTVTDAAGNRSNRISTEVRGLVRAS